MQNDQTNSIPTVNILGVPIHQVDFATALQQLDLWITPSPPPSLTRSPCHQICTVNPEFVIDAQRDPTFAAVLRQADLCVPDGIGVVWAARLQGIRLHERVTGSDGIYRICERAAERGWTVFLLGAAPGVAQRAAEILAQRCQGLRIAGTYSGSPADADWLEIKGKLEETQPAILFVAYGHPRQDFWIAQHRHELPANVAIGVGGALDFVAGVQRRAPVWVQRLALEWLYRLLREPWRWRRMSKIPQFILSVASNYWRSSAKSS